MIFVTLGSQKFQFNRLLKKIDELIENKVITDDVFAQIGYSDYIPKNYKYKQFLNRDEFTETESKADIVITHGGTGAIIGAVKKGKKVITVPRLAKYGEHVDDHQIQLLQEFDDLKIIEVCYEIEDLSKSFDKIKKVNYEIYHSNTKNIVDNIDKYIRDIFKMNKVY